MIKAVLEHLGGSIELSFGETIVGRGLSCAIRFNDLAISRQHVAFTVTETEVTVRDLGSRNGTRVNDQPLRGSVTLSDQDVLQIGNEWLRLSLRRPRSFLDEVVTLPEAVTVGTPGRVELEPPADAAQELGAEDEVGAPIAVARGSQELALPETIQRTCPVCRTRVPVPQEQCHECGHRFKARGPLSITQPTNLADLADLLADPDRLVRRDDRRSATRRPVEVPVIYHSENLTFDAVARNLSLQGMFVASELLDEVGTRCTLRVLPDGRPAISIGGVVRHVKSADAGLTDEPAGMGIRFTVMSEEALAWARDELAGTS